VYHPGRHLLLVEEQGDAGSATPFHLGREPLGLGREGFGPHSRCLGFRPGRSSSDAFSGGSPMRLRVGGVEAPGVFDPICRDHELPTEQHSRLGRGYAVLRADRLFRDMTPYSGMPAIGSFGLSAGVGEGTLGGWARCAPHEHPSQMHPLSRPPSNSPHDWCSSKNAVRATRSSRTRGAVSFPGRVRPKRVNRRSV